MGLLQTELAAHGFLLLSAELTRLRSASPRFKARDRSTVTVGEPSALVFGHVVRYPPGNRKLAASISCGSQHHTVLGGSWLHAAILKPYPSTKEELTRLAETLRDFAVGEFPYLMERVRQQFAHRPQNGAATSSAST
jgi:hypothetical protein